MYVYVWLIHFAVQQKLIQNCKATIFEYKVFKGFPQAEEAGAASCTITAPAPRGTPQGVDPGEKEVTES